MRKQDIDLIEKNECQLQLSKIIAKLIKSSGIVAAEYQIQYLKDNAEMVLPTNLNHRETVRQYELAVEDFKRDYQKKQFKNTFYKEQDETI